MNRLAFALVLFCTLASAQAGMLHSDGGLLRDAQNRVVFFHGVNAVWKKKPYYPPSAVYPTDPATLDASYFDERDGAFLAANGLNAVRLGVLHLMDEPRRRHQRLGRHTAGPETIAAKLFALDQRNLAPEARATGGGHQSGRAAADDDDVE